MRGVGVSAVVLGLGLALAAPMPAFTTQWYLASQVFEATASTLVDCPDKIGSPTAQRSPTQRICATTPLPAERFQRFSQVILGEYLTRGTLIPLDEWTSERDRLRRRFLLEHGAWTVVYEAGREETGPRRNLVVITYAQPMLTTPLLTAP